MKSGMMGMGVWIARSTVAFAMLVLSAGCSEKETGDQGMNVPEETKQKLDEAVDATREAAQKSKDATEEGWSEFSQYSIEKKEEAVDFLARQSIDLDQKVQSLSERVENLSDSGKAQVQESLDALKSKQADLRLQIEKTKNATEETWSEIRLESQKKWNAFTESLQELANKMTGS